MGIENSSKGSEEMSVTPASQTQEKKSNFKKSYTNSETTETEHSQLLAEQILMNWDGAGLAVDAQDNRMASLPPSVHTKELIAWIRKNPDMVIKDQSILPKLAKTVQNANFHSFEKQWAHYLYGSSLKNNTSQLNSVMQEKINNMHDRGRAFTEVLGAVFGDPALLFVAVNSIETDGEAKVVGGGAKGPYQIMPIHEKFFGNPKDIYDVEKASAGCYGVFLNVIGELNAYTGVKTIPAYRNGKVQSITVPSNGQRMLSRAAAFRNFAIALSKDLEKNGKQTIQPDAFFQKQGFADFSSFSHEYLKDLFYCYNVGVVGALGEEKKNPISASYVKKLEQRFLKNTGLGELKQFGLKTLSGKATRVATI